MPPWRVFLRFLRYGLLAWGGPIAQIGLMHRELVERDKWVTNERFRKVLALYQALPGPEANELAVYFGMLRAGRLGGLLAGLGFMLPGVILVTALAALYTTYGSNQGLVDLLLYGVKPAVFALVAAAAVRLARHSIPDLYHALIAIASLLLTLFVPAAHFLLVLLAGAIVGLALTRRPDVPSAAAAMPFAVLLAAPLALPMFLAVALLFLQVGLLTFGGAYTALPILHEGAVESGWITEQQFLDGLALAALVPGPLIAIGTFVGYLVGGLGGALLATVLIFAPAFAFTLIGHNFFERIVDQPHVHGVLLGITAAAIGLIAALSVSIARAAVIDAPTTIIALVAFLIITWRPYVAHVVLGGALVGAIVRYLQLNPPV